MLAIEYTHKKAYCFPIELSLIMDSFINIVIVLWQLVSWELPLK